MKFLPFLCTKWMENCEAMTSSPHSFAYSYRLVKKYFLKICETSKCYNFFIFQPIFIRFSLLCLKMFTLSSEIKLNLLWSSSLSFYIFGTGIRYIGLYVIWIMWTHCGVWTEWVIKQKTNKLPQNCYSSQKLCSQLFSSKACMYVQTAPTFVFCRTLRRDLAFAIFIMRMT